MSYFANPMPTPPDAPCLDAFLNANPLWQTVCEQVRRLALHAGVAAYLVGGPVRDHLLGAPVKDLDIAVVGSAPSLARSLADALGGRLTVHPRFRTAAVQLPHSPFSVDLVTARRETYSHPGALPDVTPGTIADDLARRDFTINAMAIPLCGDDRNLVDPHHGRADLNAGIIRALRPDSFHEDPTRIFRAVRYEQRFGFRIDPTTLANIRSALDAGAVATLSGPRIASELARIIREPAPLPALRRAAELGVLAAVHPAMPATQRWDKLEGWSSLPPGMQPLGRECPMSWDAALFWTLTSEQVASLGLKDPGRVRRARYVETLPDILPQLSADGLAPSDVCALLDYPPLERDPFSITAALTVALAFAEPRAADRIRLYLTEWRDMRPRVDGALLLQSGIPPGPAVGQALRSLRKAILDGQTHSIEDELRLAQQWTSQSQMD